MKTKTNETQMRGAPPLFPTTLFSFFLLISLISQTSLTLAQTISIGTGTFSFNSASPFFPAANYSYGQTIYLKEEISGIGSISTIRYYYTGTSIANSDSVTVYMAHVSRDSFGSNTSWEPLANLTEVFKGNISATIPGWVTITLATPFPYNNTDNLLIAVDENRPGSSGEAGFRVSIAPPHMRTLYARNSLDNIDPASPPSGTTSAHFANIQIEGLTPSGCLSVTNLALNSMTYNTADLSWSVPGGDLPTQYNWELRTYNGPGSGSSGLQQSGNSLVNSQSLSGLAANTTYSFYVRTDCGSLHSLWSAPLTIVPVYDTPANNECANAIPVTVNSGISCTTVTPGMVASASASAGPTSPCGTFDDDIWYSFVATSTAHMISLQYVTGGNDQPIFQVLESCGATTALGCGNYNQPLSLSSLIPGNTYLLRIATLNTGPNRFAFFNICITSIPADMTYVSATTLNGATGVNFPGMVNSPIIAVPVTVIGQNNPLTLTQLDFTTNGTTNAADISQARVYYTGTSNIFSAANPFGAAVSNPNGAFSVTGSQVLTGSPSNTANYFWLVYDISCSATGGNFLDATCTGLQVNGPQVPIVTAPSGGIELLNAFLLYKQGGYSGTFSPRAGATNVPFGNISSTGNSNCPGNVSEVSFSVSGTSPANDIAQAKCFYTSTSTFNTNTPFGAPIINPAGTVTFTGSQNLVPGNNNFFWLAYDIACSMPEFNVINGDAMSITINSVAAIPPGTSKPAVSALPTVFAAAAGGVPVYAGSINNEMLRIVVTPCSPAASTVESLTFNAGNTTNPANILNAKVYYTEGLDYGFSTAILYGSPVALPNGNYTVTGSQNIGAGASGNFWLAYDLDCNTPVGNIMDAACTGISLSGTNYPVVTANPAGNRTVTGPSIVNLRASFSVIPKGAAGQLILYETINSCVGSVVSNITFGTTGTTNTADIVNARVYYTITPSPVNAVLFGSAVVNPGTSFTVTGSQVLSTGTGYFWLTYDISPAATTGNIINGSCASAVVDGTTLIPVSSQPFGSRVVSIPIGNDNASGAIPLVVDAVCSGAVYNNDNASQMINEPFPDCMGTAGSGSVWFSFNAPASGAVSIAQGLSGTLSNSRMALFSATDVNDYTTFDIIACDDDNFAASKPLFYVTGLSPGTTYYLLMDGEYVTTPRGSFCINLATLTSDMIVTTEGPCVASTTITGFNPDYRGWISLVQPSTNKLIANIRQTAGNAIRYTASQTVTTGGPRTDASGQAYLNRNFFFQNTSGILTNADIQLFFTNAEVANLGAVLSGLNVSRFAGNACTATPSGTATLLLQTAGNTANGVSWIQTSTPGFSNFFIQNGTTPLPLSLKSFTGRQDGSVHILNWETATEKNLDHFELQRSADGVSFDNLAFFRAQKQNQGGKYRFRDEHPLTGQNLYRLKITDAAGTSVLSEIVSLTTPAGNEGWIKIYPNPVKQTLYINVSGKTGEKGRVQIMDLSGRLIQTFSFTGTEARVAMKDWPAGTYIVRYTSNNYISVTKVVKE